MSVPGNNPSNPPSFGGSSSLPNPYGDRAGTTYAPSPAAGYGGPYGPPGTPPGPTKSSGCLIGGIVAGILGLLVLSCGGCGLLGYFALEGQHSETARQLSADYHMHPKVKEQVGEIQEVKY